MGPDYFLGIRAGLTAPPPSTGEYSLEQEHHLRALLQINEHLDITGATPLGLLAARNEAMMRLGLLNPLTLLAAVQLTPISHLFQADPSENFLVQCYARYQVIFIVVAILSIYHHEHYRDEPLRQNLKDWKVDTGRTRRFQPALSYLDIGRSYTIFLCAGAVF